MVRYAVDKNGVLLDAQRKTCNNEDDSYTCLFCQAPLTFRKGSIKTMSKTRKIFECVSCFTHGTNDMSCISDNFVSSRGESEIHKKGKDATVDIIRKTAELYFPKDNILPIKEFEYLGDYRRRADVAATRNGTGFANFEIQVSPIPFETTESRCDKDKKNKVGNTYFIVGEIDKTIKTGNKGVGGNNTSQARLEDSIFNEHKIVHTIEEVVTRQKIITFRDRRSNFEYKTPPITIDSHVIINQRREGEFSPSPLTIIKVAQLLEDSIIKQEQLNKNTTYFNSSSDTNIDSSSVNPLYDDEDDDRYDTCLSALRSKNIEKIRLICKTNKGYTGVILRINLKSKKAKVLLLNENNPVEIDFKYLYVSEKDAKSFLNNSNASYIKNNSVFSEDSTQYLEYISEREVIIPSSTNTNPINNFDDALFRRINEIDESPVTKKAEVLNLDHPILVNETILDIPNEAIKDSNTDSSKSFDIQCVSRSKDVYDYADLYDYSMINVGSRVRSTIYKNMAGIVAKKEVIEVSGIPSATFITVQWDNGEISHPYPHQIAIELVLNK